VSHYRPPKTQYASPEEWEREVNRMTQDYQKRRTNMVRAKFHLSEVHNLSWGSKRFVFKPQYDTSIEEDRRFAKASPDGRFEIVVDNPSAAEQFNLGAFYYVDFTPAESVPA
jgi:uncharacterized DUF497 family protein